MSKKCSGVPHAATPVTLTEANPSRYCGRSLIVAMPDLEAGRDPRRKHRKDNAVRRSFCSFQLTVSFRRDQTKLAARKRCTNVASLAYAGMDFPPSWNNTWSHSVNAALHAKYHRLMKSTLQNPEIRFSISSFVQRLMRHLLIVIKPTDPQVVLCCGLVGQQLIGNVKDNH